MQIKKLLKPEVFQGYVNGVFLSVIKPHALNSVQLTMFYLVLIAFGTFISHSGFVDVAEAGKAKILLHSMNNNSSPNVFELNPDVLEEISQIKQPIRVLAAIGNARVGKSTLLNLVAHNLDEKRTSSATEEVFKTGDSLEAVTRNVWAYIIHHRDIEGSMLLLDVEGTNIGDDTVTDRLSMFTAIMSSCLNVFAVDFVGNYDIDFLYHIARLSDLVFKDKSILDNFPKLQIVLRTNLGGDGDYVVEKIINSEAQKRREGEMKMIYKFFPKDSIAVTRIPFVNNASKLFKDQKVLEESSDWNAFKSLVEKIKKCPEKKTFGGSSIDGEAVKDLAERIVQAMNNNSWLWLENSYEIWEGDVCRKYYKKIIEPVLKRPTSKEIREQMMEAFEKFKRGCSLERETKDAKEKLKSALEHKIMLEKEEKREESWFTYAFYVGPFIAGRLSCYLYSDEDLKDNLTTLSWSKYNDIGLREVCWKWNGNAKKTFGLTGEDCGVIAQEVKVLYPWAVAEGKDGYLRVHYGMLHEMIKVVHSNRNSSNFT